MKFKNIKLGEMEEVVLLCILLLNQRAYEKNIANEIHVRFERRFNVSGVHMALRRMLDKNYLSYKMSKIVKKRGGKAKKIYSLTPQGKEALFFCMSPKTEIWEKVRFSLENGD